MAINCETKKRIIAYFTSIICGPFANDYSLLAYGDCHVGVKVNEECKDLSGQHLLTITVLVRCIKCIALLLSFYPAVCWRMCSVTDPIRLNHLYSFFSVLLATKCSLCEPRTEIIWSAVEPACLLCLWWGFCNSSMPCISQNHHSPDFRARSFLLFITVGHM